ncbi:MAG: pyruvate dehydrogenase (acetyl-transferring) E1 component subunit alpha [Candidatus Nanohaloarchaea archaeon]|nr:pyruvate dehydrogenase (acetyl-transferring) E1 component subunit alpha [Candidatus Nanohaloarchaea archaeon]
MPRETVASFDVEKVQVLDADGTVDEDLLPDLSDDDLLAMYRLMKRSRRLDRKAISLQRRGEIGTYAPAIGQEAAQVGSAYALQDEDWMVPSFREQPAYLTRGVPMHALLWYAMGMEEAGEPSGNDMPPAIPVGSQTLHAAGLGWAQQITGEEAATLVYFGDGATSEGDANEALNFAGVFDAHTVFLCQNNQYAISVPRDKQTDAATLAQKAIGQGVDCLQVDGNDVLGVYRVTEQALQQARDGTPTMIEAVTYRQSMHTTSDDPSVYRDEEEAEEWKKKDPIDRFRNYLEDEGVLDDDTIEEMEADIEDEVAEEVETAKAGEADVDPADMFEHVYDEMPPELEQQLQELREVEQDG